jgi:hypothetical protein
MPLSYGNLWDILYLNFALHCTVHDRSVVHPASGYWGTSLSEGCQSVKLTVSSVHLYGVVLNQNDNYILPEKVI